jgi:thiamine-monophosphate kinase
VSDELAFIDALRSMAGHPAARGLSDDAAVLEFGGRSLVLTHDMIVEGVHFLAADPPEDVAWKLVAVNLSDLAAKGARPIGVLVGYSLAPAADWNDAFIEGLGAALKAHDTALLGGDTVSAPSDAPRSFGLTAIGETSTVPPSRAGASPGDLLWVSGTIGDAGAGLRVSVGEFGGPTDLVERYRRPQPRLALGQALAPLVSAMMDVSDGLLIDAARMSQTSGLAAEVELDQIPVSDAFLALLGGGQRTRINAAIAGDDYELLFAAPEVRSDAIRQAGAAAGVPVTCIGRFAAGQGLSLLHEGAVIPLPPRLGYEHNAAAG